MFDDLVSNIIKKLVAMPNFTISPDAEQEFLLRCSRISFDKKITAETLANDFIQYPATCMYRSEKSAVTNYTLWLAETSREIEFLFQIMSSTCIMLTDNLLDGELLPVLLITILAKFPDQLSRLHEVLTYSEKIQCESRPLRETNIGVEILLSPEEIIQSTSLSEDESALKAKFEEMQRKKVDEILEKLRDPDFFVQQFLILKINMLCASKMNECYNIIYQIFKDNNFNEFEDTSSGLDGRHKLNAQNENVLKMFNNEDHPFFKAHANAWNNLKKYIAYQEFYATFCYSSASIFDKLRAFVYKFPHFQADLGDDKWYAKIGLPADIREYLGIEDTYTTRASSLITFSFLWQTPYETKISFGTFVDALTNKIKSLEQEADAPLTAAALPVTPA
ncbi:MAG TPA: hypothetical protein VL360_01280 [Gammaproteobacteria bacterium]|jgi:hypothetical protein|nr:hypothetical protein [Gammaproteobacteria bacterium]